MGFDIKRIKFEHNVGSNDQKVRYAIGILSAGYSLIVANVFFLLIGIVLIGSAYLTWCPAYSGFAMNTCDTDASKKGETRVSG